MVITEGKEEIGVLPGVVKRVWRSLEGVSSLLYRLRASTNFDEKHSSLNRNVGEKENSCRTGVIAADKKTCGAHHWRTSEFMQIGAIAVRKFCCT